MIPPQGKTNRHRANVDRVPYLVMTPEMITYALVPAEERQCHLRARAGPQQRTADVGSSRCFGCASALAWVWHRRRVNLRVIGDSVTAMALLLKLKARGSGPALVPREIALDMAEALYQPNVVGHLPGVANTIADWMSRPRKRRTLPEPRALAGAVRRRVPLRGRSWWRSIE